MSTTDRPSETTDTPLATGPESGSKTVETPKKFVLPKSLPLTALAVGVIAGILAWGFGETTYDRFKPSAKAAAEPYEFTQLNIEKDRADGWNAALAYGFLGGVTALGLGLAGGWAGGSTRRGILAGLIGIATAAAASALIAPAVVPLYRKFYDPVNPDLKVPIMIHGAIWCALGLAGGLAFGLGLGDRRRIVPAAVGGLIGAALATILIDLIGAVAFTAPQVDLPISPLLPGRILAHLVVAVGIAFGATWAVRESRRVVKSPIREV